MKFIRPILPQLCLSFFLLNSVIAEVDHTEYKIKAGYVYNFIKFITWPQLNTAQFNICILGQDPFGSLIKPIENRTAFGLPIKLLRADSLVKNLNCQIAYIGNENASALLADTQKKLGNNSKTLVVGDGDNFAEQGGMIGLVNREDGIKLNINVRSIQQSGLSVSAKLLEIAEIVGRDGHD